MVNHPSGSSAKVSCSRVALKRCIKTEIRWNVVIIDERVGVCWLVHCRGFDIGNHFCEWCYCYDCEEFPYFTARLEEYPSREQQVIVA